MNSRDEGVLRGPRQPGSGAARNSARLLIADAMHSYRRFIKQVLESTGDLKVVGEAADGEEVVRLAQQLKPDVVLMDIDLPDLDGLEAIRRIKAAQPGTKVIMLSLLDGETYRKAAAKLGTDAFLLKGAEISELLSVVAWRDRPRAIACKGGGVCPNVAKIL